MSVCPTVSGLRFYGCSHPCFIDFPEGDLRENLLIKKPYCVPIAMNVFPVWLRNRLISARSEPGLRHTETPCIVGYHIQLSTNNKIKIIKLIFFRPPLVYTSRCLYCIS